MSPRDRRSYGLTGGSRLCTGGVLSPYEVSRQVLPHVLKQRGLIGQGVEVGVCEGHFSECILAHWPGILYLVDPWSPLEGYQEHYDHEETYRACLKRLRPYIPRFKIL